jgi:hypothetical protein
MTVMDPYNAVVTDDSMAAFRELIGTPPVAESTSS